MELDEMRRAWARDEGRLDKSIRLSAGLLQERILHRAETALQRLTRLLVVELGANILAAVLLGSFIAANIGDLRFVIPAAAIDLCVIALLIAGVRQLVAVGGIDYGQPVLAIQRRLESLRAERIRATMLTLVASPLLWTPLLIVALKGVFGVNAYEVLSSAWLAANVAFGLLVIVVAILVSRRYAGRAEGSTLLQGLMRNLAGRNLEQATRFVRSIDRFDID